MAAQRVAIIGAGASGLCALKCCLDEGLEPTCFERSKDIGGLWRFEVRPMHASLPHGTSMNGTGIGSWQIMKHHSPALQACARQISKVNDRKVKQLGSRRSQLVCWAHGTHLLPTSSSTDALQGPHPSAYSPSSAFLLPIPPFLVSSTSCSADLLLPSLRMLPCCHLSSPFSQVFLSTKHGTWVLHRVADNGYPFDFSNLSRFKQLHLSLLPQNITSFFVERKVNARFDHTLYGLKPQHRIFDQHPTINDDLPNRIISGRVQVKPNIQEFTETSAIFEDGTREDIDVIVFATGYSFSFPFLEGFVKVVENQIPLYKFMFPPDLEKPTLAFIGLIQPLGAIMPISELQCRWATRVFKGLQDLPPLANMVAEITSTKDQMAKRYVKSQRHTIQVDYIPYMDELACQLGVKPNLLTLFLTDPKLALEVAFGPCTPYQYRLRGPGAWAGAREAILTQRQRVVRALQPRGRARPSVLPRILMVFFSIIGVIAAILAYGSRS
ncbi:FMO5 monooxygenase, partial [Piprites chloris]|nr:FMO5 monooxygenase [Piprites chloris]